MVCLRACIEFILVITHMFELIIQLCIWQILYAILVYICHAILFLGCTYVLLRGYITN